MTYCFYFEGIITNGGAKPNIIPEETSMLYYVRAPSLSEHKLLVKKIAACFEAAAKATGCQVSNVISYLKTDSCTNPVWHVM